jgi:hypothetical protein
MTEEAKQYAVGPRDNGRFGKGNSGGPGRPKKEVELAMLEAINTTFTREEIQDFIRQAMQVAIDTKSARGMVSVLDFVTDRTLGKAVQQVTVTENDAMLEALETLRQQDEELARQQEEENQDE